MSRALCIAIVLVASTVRAQPEDDDSERERPDPSWKYPVMIGEASVALAPLALDGWEVRQPFTGAALYQVGRANGWSPWLSLALDVAFSAYRPSVAGASANIAGGLFVGEPLFQIAAVGEDGRSPYRSALAWVTSPFHSAQKTAHASWMRPALEPSAVLELQLAPSVFRGNGAARTELQTGLDLTAITDPTYGLPGTGTTTTALGGWNHAALDLRFGHADGANGVTGVRFRSETSYWSSYHRAFDELGTGDARQFQLGGGIDLGDRHLADDRDQFSVIELAGPSMTLSRRTRALAIDGTLGAYGDVARVEAYADRMGTYDAPGATAIARVHVRGERWTSSIDATAHAFWSDATDQRLLTTARVGVQPTADQDFRIDAFADLIGRRGTHAGDSRTGSELDAGLGVTLGL